MVLVGVADQDGINLQLRDINMRACCTEGQSNIEKNGGSSRSDLYAGSTDFMSAFVNQNLQFKPLS